MGNSSLGSDGFFTGYHMFQNIRLLALALGLSWILAVGAQPGAKLQYQMKKGDTLVYEIKLVANIGDTRETREGTSIYTVQTVTDQEITMVHEGSMNTRRTTRDGRPVITIPSFGSIWADNISAVKGKVTMGARGERLEPEFHTSLPYMMGDFQTLVLEEFPGDGKTKWEKSREVSVIKKKNSPFPPLPRGPFGNRGDENEEARSAREKVSYEIIQGTADSVKIKKRYQLVTDDKVKGKPRREMQGEGEQTFDPKQGVFRSQAISYELNLNDENITLTIPITVSYRLLSTEEGIAKLKQIEESRQKASENLKKMQEPLQVTKDDLKGLLEQIKTTNKSQARAAIDKLARATPEGDKEEVCKALLQALQSGDHFTKISAAKALAVWGTPTAGSALLQEIKGKDVFVRKAALEAIGKLNLKEAPLAVAPLLIEHSTRADAVNALKAMGPMAEEAVLPYLDDRDAFVQMEACKVLESIGTEKSIEKIRKYGVSGKPFAKDTSAKAIQAIQQRK
jgi:hypothetical protein